MTTRIEGMKKNIDYRLLVLVWSSLTLMLTTAACSSQKSDNPLDSDVSTDTGGAKDSSSTPGNHDSATTENSTDSMRDTGRDSSSTGPEDTHGPKDSSTIAGSDDSEIPEDGTDSLAGTDVESSDPEDTGDTADSEMTRDSDSETTEDSTDSIDGNGSDSDDTDETVDTATADNPDDTETTENNETSLYKKYKKYFPIGAAIDASSYQDGHVGILKEHFNSVVCENEMKWTALQASQGGFNYSPADQMVQFAQNNGMLIRGHVLVWHTQTPDWVFQGPSGGTISKEGLLERIRTHVTAVMTHFKGKVYAWDVVNEAVTGNKANGEDAGEDLSQVVEWGYRNSKWYQIAGEDYILEAFRAARAADPGAKLFYNDYWNYLDEKRAFIISIIEKLQAENLIDGVGLQCHLNISAAQVEMTNQTVHQTVENLEKEIQEYAALGLDVHITELDISIYTRDYPSSDSSKWYTGDTLNEDYQNRLAARYKEFFEMFRRNSDLLTNVTLWGIADDNTWLSEFPSGRPDQPLLWDRYLQPKKAFDAVMDF